MTPTQVFSIANTLVLPMWLLMILAPNWKATRFLVDVKIIPILLSILYALFIFKSVQSGGKMDFSSLDSVMKLFTQENAVLAGWLHYLAFDLLVGMWMLDQNRQLKIHPVLMAPCLIGAFLLGPVGFLIFTVIKSFKTKRP